MFSHQKPSNGGFADSKVASSGAITPNRSSLVAVAESRMRIGKRFLWCPRGSKDGVWRGEDQNDGVWRKPSDVGLPKKEDAMVGKNYRWHLFNTEDPRERLSLRRQLARQTTTALVLGLPCERMMDAFHPDQYGNLVSDYGAFRRIDGVFVDEPRDYLLLDIDNLDLGRFRDDIDVIRDNANIHNVLIEVLGDIGLDWLHAQFFMHLSSSHGLFGRQKLKAHVEWKLARPLTLAQQKSVATYVNEQATRAGYGKICDTTIYEPSRILFTSPPELLRRVWHDGKGISKELLTASE